MTGAAEKFRSAEKSFVLGYVQPGLVGLIDGTLSTLAPIFAAALLAGPRAALLVGLATALGAGISMGLPDASPTTAARPDAARRSPVVR